MILDAAEIVSIILTIIIFPLLVIDHVKDKKLFLKWLEEKDQKYHEQA